MTMAEAAEATATPDVPADAVVSEESNVIPPFNPFSEPDEDSDVVLRVEEAHLHVHNEEAEVTPLFNPFSEPDEDSDALLRVEGTDLHVHKIILSRASPVFRAMLRGNFKEKQSGVVDLPDKKLKDVVNFLCEIYADVESQMTTDNVLNILSVASEYQASRIISRVDDFMWIALQNQQMSVMDPAVLKVISGIHELKQTRSYCVEELKFLHSSTFLKKDFFELDDKFLNEILQRRLGRIEKCMKDIVPVFRYLLWLVYSAQQIMKGKNICTEHKKRDDFSFISKCEKCKTLFKQILRGCFLSNRDGTPSFHTSHYGYCESQQISFNTEKPIVGTPFKGVSTTGKWGTGWKYMTDELGNLIDDINRLNFV